VVDPVTEGAAVHISELFDKGESRLHDLIKREMHQSVIEVGTPICKDVREARREVVRLRREILQLSGKMARESPPPALTLSPTG